MKNTALKYYQIYFSVPSITLILMCKSSLLKITILCAISFSGYPEGWCGVWLSSFEWFHLAVWELTLHSWCCIWQGFLGGSVAHLPILEIWVQSLGQEEPLEKEMTTYSSSLAWEVPWTEEPGMLYSPWGCKWVRQALVTKQQYQPLTGIQCGIV